MSHQKKKLELSYKYPPDFQAAQKHRLAMRIFKGIQKDQLRDECECCERRVGVNENMGKCCFDNMDVAFLGTGIPLFFTFLRNSIILLFLLGVVFVGFAFYSNMQGTDCETGCDSSIFNTFAIVNKVSLLNYLTIQNYTVVGFVVLFLIIMQGFRYSFRKVEDDCDDAIDSPSDYAMILRRLPPDIKEEDINQMINERRGFLTQLEREKTENLRVVSVILSYGMREHTEVKAKNIQKFQQCLADDKLDEFQPEELPPLDKSSSIAVVVFARQQSKQLFKYKPNIFQKILQFIFTPCIPKSDYRIKGENVAIQRAPEPDDIVWENAGISMGGAICRKSLYSFLSILILFAGGAAQYGLAVLTLSVSQDDQTQLLMSTLSSICVSILNAIIQFFLIFTSHKERNQTLTEYNTVLMIKISFFQFLNTGVFVIAATFLANMDGFTLSQGLVFQICQVMLLNAVVPNVLLLILNYWEVPLKIQRCLTQRGTLKKSQLESNYLWQGPAAQIPYKYAYIFKTIWLTAFYAPLAPIVVPIGIVALVFNYILEKCLYGTTYSTPNLLSSMLNDSAIELLEYFPLILSLGEFIIYLYIKNFQVEKMPQYWSIPIYVAIGLSILNLLLPMDELNNKIWKMPTDNFVYPNYEQVEKKFEVTYEMTNPGYICKRKRNRDMFMLNNLFGKTNGPMDITNMGLFTQGNQVNAPLNSNQNQIYGQPGQPGQLGQPGQPGQLGQPGQPGQPGQQNPNNGFGGNSSSRNNGGSNPFGALFAAGSNPAARDQQSILSARQALAGVKKNEAQGNEKPLNISMMDEMNEQDLQMQSQSFNVVESQYMRNQLNTNILGGLNPGNSSQNSKPYPSNNSPNQIPFGFNQPQPGFNNPQPGSNQPNGFNMPGASNQPQGFLNPNQGFQNAPGFYKPTELNPNTEIQFNQIALNITEQEYGSVNSNNNKKIKKQLKRSFKIPPALTNSFNEAEQNLR